MKNRKVIVTGAAHGIGRALALAFAQEGAQVAICSRGRDSLECVSKEMEGSGHIFFAADLSKPEGIHDFFDKAKEALNGIDVLINNAGILLRPSDLANVTAEQMMTTYQVNVVAPLMLTKVCATKSIGTMRKQICLIENKFLVSPPGL